MKPTLALLLMRGMMTESRPVVFVAMYTSATGTGAPGW